MVCKLQRRNAANRMTKVQSGSMQVKKWMSAAPKETHVHTHTHTCTDTRMHTDTHKYLPIHT